MRNRTTLTQKVKTMPTLPTFHGNARKVTQEYQGTLGGKALKDTCLVNLRDFKVRKNDLQSIKRYLVF